MCSEELRQEEIDALLNKAVKRVSVEKSTEYAAPQEGATPDFERLLDVPLDVRVRLGEAELTLVDVARLSEGSLIKLDRAPGEGVDIIVNGHLFARGETVIVDEQFTVKITELMVKNLQESA